jgi:hypothetical protein
MISNRVQFKIQKEKLMRNKRTAFLSMATAGALATVGLLAGCSSDDSGLDEFTVVSAKPDQTLIDTGKGDYSLGDYTVFSAPVTKDGDGFGTLYGTKLAVAEPPVDSAPSSDLGLFQNQLSFVLPDGTISINGVQYFTVDGSIPDPSLGEGEVRAIVGGTGAYAGASGTLKTTARPDGTRQQEFDFED